MIDELARFMHKTSIVMLLNVRKGTALFIVIFGLATQPQDLRADCVRSLNEVGSNGHPVRYEQNGRYRYMQLAAAAYASAKADADSRNIKVQTILEMWLANRDLRVRFARERGFSGRPKKLSTAPENGSNRNNTNGTASDEARRKAIIKGKPGEVRLGRNAVLANRIIAYAKFASVDRGLERAVVELIAVTDIIARTVKLETERALDEGKSHLIPTIARQTLLSNPKLREWIENRLRGEDPPPPSKEWRQWRKNLGEQGIASEPRALPSSTRAAVDPSDISSPKDYAITSLHELWGDARVDLKGIHPKVLEDLDVAVVAFFIKNGSIGEFEHSRNFREFLSSYGLSLEKYLSTGSFRKDQDGFPRGVHASPLDGLKKLRPIVIEQMEAVAAKLKTADATMKREAIEELEELLRNTQLVLRGMNRAIISRMDRESAMTEIDRLVIDFILREGRSPIFHQKNSPRNDFVKFGVTENSYNEWIQHHLNRENALNKLYNKVGEFGLTDEQMTTVLNVLGEEVAGARTVRP